MFDKFRIKITILASLIITAYCFFMNVDFLRACYTIIFTIILFYILGGIAEIKLKEYVEKQKEQEKNKNKNKEEESKENIDDKEDISNKTIVNSTNDDEEFEEDFYNSIDFNDEQESF